MMAGGRVSADGDGGTAAGIAAAIMAGGPATMVGVLMESGCGVTRRIQEVEQMQEAVSPPVGRSGPGLIGRGIQKSRPKARRMPAIDLTLSRFHSQFG